MQPGCRFARPLSGEVDDLRLSRGVLQHAAAAFLSGISVSSGIRTGACKSELRERQIEKNGIFKKKMGLWICGQLCRVPHIPTRLNNNNFSTVR